MVIRQQDNHKTFHSNIAIPPGEYLEELIDEIGMSKNELARRLERPASKLSAIFKGEKAITPDTALRLEKVIGVPAHIWTGLEAEYRLVQARIDERRHDERLKSETHLVSKYCYNDLVKLGDVEKKTKPVDKVKELLRFFGALSLTTIPGLRRYQPAFRLGATGSCSPEALASWIRFGERRASQINCGPFDKAHLKNQLNTLRLMSLETPDTFMPKLIDALASCGVALVICPHFKHTKAHGAAFHLREDKIALLLTIRYQWADIFWFSLFHELGHVLFHPLKEIRLEDHENSEQETEANLFAAGVLIPDHSYKHFVNKQNFSANSILSFANKAVIHPGIVVGRLQHDKLIKPQWLNRLRDKYSWGN